MAAPRRCWETSSSAATATSPSALRTAATARPASLDGGELAEQASIPVINGLSDSEHPCQALADLLTLSEAWPTFSGKELVYVGDWNNVSRSLWQACALADLRFRAICPEDYGPGEDEQVEWSANPEDVKGADAIYTDVWASMGQEQEAVKRKKAFRAYQVNSALFALARPDAVFISRLDASR